MDHLTLTIEDGDIYGFIGHNGAGKTTTIKAVAGILDFDDGDILIDHMSIKTHPLECKEKMAYIPDNPDIYEYLTGIKYLNFYRGYLPGRKAGAGGTHPKICGHV